MRISFSANEQIVRRARGRARALGTTLTQLLREHVQAQADEHVQIERDIEEFLRLSGKGNSNGWKWNRDEIYEERLRWPRH